MRCWQIRIRGNRERDCKVEERGKDWSRMEEDKEKQDMMGSKRNREAVMLGGERAEE